MEKFNIQAISASQLLAMVIFAAKNGVNGNQTFLLDFCLRKSDKSANRSRASTSYEILVNLPWLGNGGVFIMADESGKLLNLKFEQFGRWLAKLGSGTLGQVLETKITLLNLSDLGRPMTGQAGSAALSAFQAWAGAGKLQADIDKATETLQSWGVEILDSEEVNQPPMPPEYSDWWQRVGAGAELSADIGVITTGEAVDLDGESAKGIFEAAKGGRSSRNSAKKLDLAKKLAVQKHIKSAQSAANTVIENEYLGAFNASIGYSDSEDGGGSVEY